MKKKQTTIKKQTIDHPSARLALVKMHDFIQEYHHCVQKYSINLSVGMILADLSISQQLTFKESDSFDLELNVPYVQSEHYDSNAFYEQEEEKINKISDNTRRTDQLEDQNFTDQQEQESRLGKLNEESIKIAHNSKYHRFVADQDDEDDINSDDFQFTSRNKEKAVCSSNKDSVVSYPFSSTNYEETQSKDHPKMIFFKEHEEENLQTLKETAYFYLEKERIDRKINFDAKDEQHKENQLSNRNKNKQILNIKEKAEKSKPTLKEMMINKIQKQKSRKEIAASLIKDKNFVKKFIK